MFTPDNMCINTRSSYKKLIQPFRKTNTGQNSLSYLGPAFWNNLPESIKKVENINNFKHKLKEHYLNQLNQLGNNH